MNGLPSLPPLRGLSEWRRLGVDLGTTSEEAAKMLDALLYQRFGLFESVELDGVDGTLKRMIEADPNSAVTQILQLQLKIADKSSSSDDIISSLESKLLTVNDWEKMHIQAALAQVRGRAAEAARLWEDCLAIAPGDLLAGIQSFGYNLSHGTPNGMCFTFAQLCKNVLPSDPFYAFLQSRLAFGMTETGRHSEARGLLEASLGHSPWDPWSHHTMAHVHENLGQSFEGLKFSQEHSSLWALPGGCSLLACHNYWHQAVFAWDLGQVDTILDLVDREILPRVLRPMSTPLFPLSDAISILLRLEYEARVPRSELQRRWELIYEQLDSTGTLQSSSGEPFYDVHIAMSLLAARKPDKFRDYINTIHNQLEELLSDNVTHDQVHRMNSAGWILLQGAEKYFAGDFHAAADLLFHERHQWAQLGGSRAQQDVFLWMLFYSLARSGQSLHWARVRMLLTERMWTRQSSAAVDTLNATLLTAHSSDYTSSVMVEQGKSHFSKMHNWNTDNYTPRLK